MTTTAPGSTPTHTHAAELKNPDGSWKYTNGLARETSPYLLQHAHNPVDWRPWGPEAFDLARKANKPIFLSIGYATCYWCHVMERQVFENPTLAAQLNEHFVSIKVDREERPDVDDIYMAAVQLMTRHGGWPMSVFLTPPNAGGPEDKGLKPFWTGTYIPPEPAHGMPGFGQVVQRLAEAWETDRDQVVAQAGRIADAVTEHLTQRHAQGELSAGLVQAAAGQLTRSYDPVNGGFGSSAQGPKFPQPSGVAFLIAVHENHPNPQLWTAIAYTLERMASGGMYDQVGGGFHRYSTDGQWLVPHFEKMLYDNGQLLELYADAQQVKPHPKDPDFYTRVLRETCEYVLREMTNAPESAPDDHLFWSAQDAEVDAHEGQNYLWTEQQIRDTIDDPKLAGLALAMYGLDRGTNFKDPHNPDAAPANVLYLPKRLDQVAAAQNISLDDLLAARRQINDRLLAARDRRKQPITDDKSLVSWNSSMIAGLARAGRALDEPRYTDAAARAADDILRLMRSPDGHLLRTRRRGESKIPAFLEDYAFFAHALLELHRATGEPSRLDTAKDIMQIADTLFSAQDQRGGGYFDTLPDQGDLFVRSVSTYDGAIPSGNSQMVHNLLTLYELTGEDRYRDRAMVDLRASAGALEQYGTGMAHMQHALLRALQAAPDRADRSPVQSPGLKPSANVAVVTADVQPTSIDLSGGESSLIITLNIQPGYHINAADSIVDGLIPTKLHLEGAPGWSVTADFPKAIQKKYPFADQPLRVYEGTISINARVHRDQSAPVTASSATAGLVVQFQACTESACLEPGLIRLPIKFTGQPE